MQWSMFFGLVVASVLQLLLYIDSDAENVLILDTSVYDPRFKWYNTNGSLPIVENNSVTFTSNNKTNVYQDAVSVVSLPVKKQAELYAKVEYNIEGYSYTDKDEFAIFVTSDINTYDKHEFGFTLSQRDGMLYAYTQSPKLNGFFIWKPLFNVRNGEIYELYAVYLNGVVRFYVNNNLVWEKPFINLNKENMHMVLTSHKLSNESVDLSNNYMRIHGAYIKSS